MGTEIYGLIGRKLGHSYSPAIHSALGNPDYRLYELEPEALGDFLKREDLGGVNVTIPYKLAAMEFCDVLSPEAAAIGSVNTIVNRGGKRWGYNTDQTGFIYMTKTAGIDFQGKKVLVLGSGGASRTACYCARRLGADSVTVISRTGPDHYGNLEKHAGADLIVNTTPVGMYPQSGQAPLSLRLFPRCSGVVDLIYNPLRTKLLMEAETLQIPHTGGLSMLTAQAKAAAELFFDRPVPEEKLGQITAQLTRQCENIVLIGMPGGGKSTVGKALAALTGRPLLETDEMVAAAAGRSIPEIFAAGGEDAFRKLESEAIRQAGARSGAIVVTGGGAVVREENYEPLHQNGRIYEIIRRTEQLATEGRPLSAGPAALQELYRKRKPLYERFRDAAVENQASVESAARKIWEDFCENTGNERPEY